MANELVFDGYLDFLGGQDASKIPDRIAENAYAAGVNVSINQGSLKPRWGVELKKIKFPEGGVTSAPGQTRSYKTIFQNGKFQAIAPYSVGNQPYLVVVVSGIIYLINQKTFEAQIIEIADKTRIGGHADRINWEPAGKYLILHDFPAFPVIVDGISARRANPKKFEIPVSNIGAYNQNRLFIGNAGNEFTGGDPVGNLAAPDAPITFKEVEQVGAAFFGQIFELNTNYNNDPITAMSFLQATDTSTGIGTLIVATKNAIYSYGTNVPRAQWEAGQFGSILVFNSGIVSNRAVTNVNSDLMFQSQDGHIRSVAMSRQEQQKWSKTPLSKEVQNWLTFWDEDLIKFGFVQYFNNKVFIGVNPFRSRAFDIEGNKLSDYAHGGMIVLELDNISGLGKEANPAWAGLWTPCRPIDMVVSDNTCFIVSKDNGLVNKIYEFHPERTYDTDDTGAVREIVSIIYTREMDFKDPFQNKGIHSLDTNFDNIQGSFTYKILYKPSHAVNFFDWRTFRHEAPWRTCGVPTPTEVNGLAGHQFRELNLGAPENQYCDPVSREFYDVFRKIQFKFILSGIHWEMHEFKIKARALAQTETQTVCNEFPIVEVPLECSDDWAIPPFKGC